MHNDGAEYHVYRVNQSFEVDSGKTAPWFDREGARTTVNSEIHTKIGDILEPTVRNLIDDMQYAELN